MSELVGIRFELQGQLEGATFNTGRFLFENGAIYIVEPEDRIGEVVEHLAQFGAIPELEEDRRKYGVSSNTNTKRDDTRKQTQEVVSRDGEENRSFAEESANFNGGTDEVSSEADADSTGSESPSTKGDRTQGSVNPKLRKAIEALDPDDDSHWTQTGKPRMDVVEQNYGSADITRRDVNEAKPDWDRDKAREAGESRETKQEQGE